MKKIGCFLLFLSLFSTVSAFADTDLTLFGAAQNQGKLTVKTATTAATTPSNFDPGTFGVFGIRFDQSKVIGHEQTIAYTPHFLESNTKAVIYNGDIMFQTPTPKIKLYGVAGPGWIFSWGTDSSG